jgi:spermidine synthase
VVRLLLSALVLGVPTLAMGATLPPAIAAASSRGEANPRAVGLLYGVNTLGAVCGAMLGTFALIEIYGVHRTIWLAALVNALVGLVARYLSRSWPEQATSTEVTAQEAPVASRGARWVIAAAAVVGLVFFLMEMVWYRLLGPVLGGSTFTFGLILSTALLGIGLGGVLHAVVSERGRPTVTTLATTCLLEALLLALPFLFADDLAVVAGLLRPLGGLGLSGLALGWAMITSVVVLPAAIVAGYQFPLLISLIRGQTAGIGSAVGLGYAANTLGSIVGALLGGFGLLHLLGAPGAWRLSVLLLLGLALALQLFAGETPIRARMAPRSLIPVAAAFVALAMMLLAPGPSAVWRHSAIGAGRASLVGKSPTEIERWKRDQRRALLWETDGVESSVGILKDNDIAFVVNGKSDGAAVGDSGTQIMGGLIGAMAHPAPRRALVIGLGTGSTAGWLADVPGMERVDVVEIEPAIVEVARRAAPVNRNVLANPRIHLIYRDAREVLLATHDTYDIIFSEPSNPYRIGVTSLFSEEFYRAVRAHLRPEGVFLQWVQAYEIFPETLRMAMATLAAVFPEVETWQTLPQDLVFAASTTHRSYDMNLLRERASVEPFRTALEKAWRTEGAEGYLAHFVAGAPLVATVAAEEAGLINTDDEPLLEYGFARSVGESNKLSIEGLRTAARRIGADRPSVTGSVDWERVTQVRMEIAALLKFPFPAPPETASEETRRLHRVLSAWASGSHEQAERELRPMLGSVHGPVQTRVAAELLLRTSSPETGRMVERLRKYRPMLAEVFSAWLAFEREDSASATRQLASVLREARTGDPWEASDVAGFGSALAVQIAQKDRASGSELLSALEQPFALFRGEDARRETAMALAEIDPGLCVRAYAVVEPFPPWTGRVLRSRVSCYQRAGSPLLGQAERDLGRFPRQAEDFQLNAAVPGPPGLAHQSGK